MPKKCYIQKEFRGETMELIKFVDTLLTHFQRRGYDLSLRQVYYQLVSRNIIPNNIRAYENLGRIINDARLAGLIDWDAIVDRGRRGYMSASWYGPKDFLKYASRIYCQNMWRHQEVYIEVMCEKQALEGVLLPVCTKYGVCLNTNKGYSSASALYECAQRLSRQTLAGKRPVVLYMGDHDPSGLDMTRDLRKRLSLLAEYEVDVKRLSLNMSQVEHHGLPPNPAKLSDSRSGEYVAKYGRSSWELDALDPDTLGKYLISAIKRRIDKDQWNKDREAQKTVRHNLGQLSEIYYGIKFDTDGLKIDVVNDDNFDSEEQDVDIPDVNNITDSDQDGEDIVDLD